MHGINPEQDVVYCAFTGKACNVLQKNGNKNVSTLHKLLYESRPLKNGGFYRVPVEYIPYKIVVVDEVSMPPMSIMKQLFTHNVYVIALGDPFQLPPINPAEDNHMLDAPHVFLDEIMRQAQESEIIRLSMDIREGRPIKDMRGNDVIIIPNKQLVTGHLSWANQILVATNDTRNNINAQMRDMLEHRGGPQDGDKVICLRNEWECFSDNDEPLVNGTIGYLRNSFSSFIKIPRTTKPAFDLQLIMSDFETDTGEVYKGLDMDKQMILTGVGQLDWDIKYRLGKNMKTKWMIPKEFAYGYAITTHKAQGSQWPNVLVIEETFPRPREEHARWLYTAVTRAENRLVLARKE